ncbi:MAG TPA: hypothetical protein PKX93_02495 [bacterium]|nr:hypothetical protein [bacterium]
MYRRILLVTTAGLFLGAKSYGHLCDNVFRQADKLIVKPETYNLSVKDRTTFKVFLQNNMDRGIAEISLLAESQAFDFVIEPRRMSVPKDQRVFFTVTMTPKPGVRTGNYPISFRLVGGGREFKSFTLSSQQEEKGEREEGPSPTSSGLLQVKKTPSIPKIDGFINEDCWKTAAVAGNFSSTTGGRTIRPTVALLTFNSEALYLGFFCREENPGLLTENDQIEILFSPTAEGRASYCLSISATGSLTGYQLDSSGSRKPWAFSGIRGAVSRGTSSWSAEIAIPFSTLGLSSPGAPSVWSLRLVRSCRGPQPEQSFWSADTSGYHRQTGTGYILLMP